MDDKWAYHQPWPCIGGCLDGAMADYTGNILRGPVPPENTHWHRHAEARAPREILVHDYEQKRIAVAWGGIRLEGHAYVWHHLRGKPHAHILAHLIAHQMKEPPHDQP
jgi:hypothetical protein